jgi:hypothetical protein
MRWIVSRFAQHRDKEAASGVRNTESYSGKRKESQATDENVVSSLDLQDLLDDCSGLPQEVNVHAPEGINLITPVGFAPMVSSCYTPNGNTDSSDGAKSGQTGLGASSPKQLAFDASMDWRMLFDQNLALDHAGFLY